MTFTNTAIKCDTWEQMERLAELARKQGYTAHPDHYNEHDFAAGARYFALYTQKTYCNAGDVEPHEIETTYTTFINSHPDISVEGC